MTAAAPLTAFGPDFPFDFTAWIRDPSGLGSVPAEQHGTEVAIVGAGIAGIVAAHELLKVGLRPVIYEVGRIGGRLRSEPFSAAPLQPSPPVWCPPHMGPTVPARSAFPQALAGLWD